MIGYDGKNWVTTADLIFIGNRRIGEIWKGNRKIYPEVELASYLKHFRLPYISSDHTLDIILSRNKYNNVISYKGVNSYIYNTDVRNLVISSEVTNYKLIYLNENMGSFAYEHKRLRLDLTDFYLKCNDSLVINMYHTYWNCFNLTGSPVCGPNVVNMGIAYWRCYNLTGSPVCGNNVIRMDYTYRNCYNLTGSIVIPNSVSSLLFTFYVNNISNVNNVRTIIDIDVILPAKWRNNGQVNGWINCVRSVSYY
jgi:hypothetical protein